MEVPASDSTVLILGGSLWADTTQPPQQGYGLAISGGRVSAAGPRGELGARFAGAQVIEAGDCVITPAFTNAHHHMYGVLAHGIPSTPLRTCSRQARLISHRPDSGLFWKSFGGLALKTGSATN